MPNWTDTIRARQAAVLEAQADDYEAVDAIPVGSVALATKVDAGPRTFTMNDLLNTLALQRAQIEELQASAATQTKVVDTTDPSVLARLEELGRQLEAFAAGTAPGAAPPPPLDPRLAQGGTGSQAFGPGGVSSGAGGAPRAATEPDVGDQGPGSPAV